MDMQTRQFAWKARVGGGLMTTYAQIARKWLKATGGELALRDGPLSYWRTEGEGRETLLFLHGFGDSKEGAFPLAFHLGRDFNFIVPDLPGFGQSFCREDLNYEMKSYVVWLEEFLDQLGVDKVHVAGNSLGGAIALHLCLAKPERVKSLVLLNNAGVIDEEAASVYDEILQDGNVFPIGNYDELDQFVRRIFYKPPYVPPFIREFVIQQRSARDEWFRYLVRQNFGHVKGKEDPQYRGLFLNDQLHRLQCPVLIVWGKEDKVLPLAFGKKGEKLMKGARFVLLEEVGHAPQVEAPRVVARHLREFFGR